VSTTRGYNTRVVLNKEGEISKEFGLEKNKEIKSGEIHWGI
jgi:hypothetical protein